MSEGEPAYESAWRILHTHDPSSRRLAAVGIEAGSRWLRSRKKSLQRSHRSWYSSNQCLPQPCASCPAPPGAMRPEYCVPSRCYRFDIEIDINDRRGRPQEMVEVEVEFIHSDDAKERWASIFELLARAGKPQLNEGLADRNEDSKYTQLRFLL
jgi:hypothetical protein